MNETTLEKAIASHTFGYDTTFDGDLHKVLIGTECNRCDDYFYSDKLTYYCDKCCV